MHLLLEVEMQARRVMLDMIVDYVSEVLNIATDEIEPMPDFGERVDTDDMRGVAKIEGTVKLPARPRQGPGRRIRRRHARRRRSRPMAVADTDVVLTDRDMTRIAQLADQWSGITLHDGKRPLVVARLQKRLRALSLETFAQYLNTSTGTRQRRARPAAGRHRHEPHVLLPRGAALQAARGEDRARTLPDTPAAEHLVRGV